MKNDDSSGTWRLAGLRTTAELLAKGMSAQQIRTQLARGDLCLVRHGVYARADMVATLASRRDGTHLLQAAAVLMATRSTVASHQTAALIHELDILGKLPRDVVLTKRPGCNRARPLGTRVHWAELSGAQVTEKHGMRVTTVARTVVDLARTLEFRAGVVTADSALHGNFVTKAELAAELASARRSRGIQRAMEVVAFADARAESVLESIARVTFRNCGLPPPELQVWAGGAEVVGRVDFLWRKFRTVAEVDGLMKYADPARAILQLERDKRLRDAGYEVVHLSWQEITENPAYVAAAIRSAFRRSQAAA
jgi:hypothetical protein